MNRQHYYKDADKELVRTAKVLSNTMRISILTILIKGRPWIKKEAFSELELKKDVLNNHLRKLKQIGLIQVKAGEVAICEDAFKQLGARFLNIF
ncbi:helix-turn-helix domain-containing protein [Mucilaginibacter sp. UR6-11]|uniref:helix-turn-helix domain-containing protein n=1 Tax=Mucilaginibacter sp. UR6-11 TaxID=1435644 RepID=UPI001E593805|nr:helix-turn-helix domain-containing protein [Mucilaginibacter sp. UR6-11]MCC8424589.1 helix-turn-helix domain-containing protein [Mucilaginibacter sp. UR6-11]